MKCVIDATVVLAYVLGEPGGDVLSTDGRHFLLSSVNLAEILAKVADRGLDPDDVMRTLRPFPIEHVDHGSDDARKGAALRVSTRSHGLSLGDRACLALAQRTDLPVMTSDKVWATLDLGIDIRLIR